jgi:protein tyrosine/serine phosphatase
MTFKFAGPVPPIQVPVLGPPFIAVPLLANLRDVASSLPSNSPPAVRPKLLYRSADPSNVDLDGLSKLHNELDIGTIFDLRSLPEIVNSGSLDEWKERISQFNSAHGGVPGPPVSRFWTPVFQADDYNPEAVALRFKHYGDADPTRGFVKAYEAILEHGAGSFGIIIKHLAGKGVGGTLIHCTAGKDRTGVLVAVVLSIVGVSPERIAAEYQLTETGLAARKPLVVGRLISTGAFGEESSESIAAAERMLGAKKESMLATIQFIVGKYGSAEGYARNYCGVSAEEIAMLKRRFLGEDEKRNGGQAVL